MTKLQLSAAEQVSDASLIDEVNKRIKAGIIDPDALALPKADTEAGGGTTPSEDEAVSRAFVEADCLDEAAARFARRDYPETLWNLEKALGRKFAGLGDLVLGTR